MEYRYAGHRAAQRAAPAFQLTWTQADLFLLHLAWWLLLVHEGKDRDFSCYNIQMSTQSRYQKGQVWSAPLWCQTQQQNFQSIPQANSLW